MWICKYTQIDGRSSAGALIEAMSMVDAYTMPYPSWTALGSHNMIHVNGIRAVALGHPDTSPVPQAQSKQSTYNVF